VSDVYDGIRTIADVVANIWCPDRRLMPPNTEVLIYSAEVQVNPRTPQIVW